MFALGLDSVEIERFIAWCAYPHHQLLRIFTAQELEYCFATPSKTAERLAVRFAAREAFFKALHGLFPALRVPLLTVLRNVSVARHPNGAPYLLINQDTLKAYIPELNFQTHVSLTHTHTTASAAVLLWMLPKDLS